MDENRIQAVMKAMMNLTFGEMQQFAGNLSQVMVTEDEEDTWGKRMDGPQNIADGLHAYCEANVENDD